MDQLLVIPLQSIVPEPFLASFRHAGWRIRVTPDIANATQILHAGNVAGIVIELDPNCPDQGRFEFLKSVQKFSPGTLVMILNADVESFQAPAAGLADAFKRVTDARTEARPQAMNLYSLSPAQERIAALVAQAYPNREIARKLKIKEQSVRNELSRIFRKMGVWNRVELALLMREGRAPQEAATAAEEGLWPVEIKPPGDPAGQETRQPV